MAKIIEKAYDMTKKIARTIFLGSPSLFTSADLNRQIEALQAQINALEGRVSGISRYNIGSSARIVDGAASIWFGVIGSTGSISVHGVTFAIQSGMGQTWTKTPPSHDGYDTYFIVLSAPTTTVTYADDPTHEIAGAKFQDGTVAEAADQLVYGTPSFSCVTSPTSVANRIAILAEVHVYKDHCVMLDNTLVENFPITQKIYGKQTSLHILDEPSDGTALKDMVAFYNRISVPIRTILPYYGDILTDALMYGWVPCVDIDRKEGCTEASVSGFGSSAIKDKYVALYGADITFGVVTENYNGTTYTLRLRITAVKTVGVPNLTGRFLTGAGKAAYSADGLTFYSLGNTGGQTKHKLTAGESGVPAHTHPTDEQGEHRHEVTYWQNGDGSADTEKHSTGWNVDGKSSLNDGVYPLGGSSTGGTNPDNCIILSAGYGSAWIGRDYLQFKTAGKHSHTAQNNDPATAANSHENRPPYMAVYYIMRVC